MKKKALLSSILTITLCLSLIAGSTFALFTDSTDFNIAVTAGKVDLEAYAGISDVYSAVGVGEGEVAEDRFLVDENDNEYKHVASLDKETFINGGVAKLDGTSLKIERLTPGDKVDVTINVTNKSNVAISYRYKIAVNTNSTYDNELASGMVLSVIDGLTFAETSYEGFESYVSEWYYVEAPAGVADAIDPRTISVELPVYAGNEYQEKSVEYTITVEAVQGNAVTTNDSIVTLLPAAVEKWLGEGGTIDGAGAILEQEKVAWVKDDVTLTNITLDGTNLSSYQLLVVAGLTEGYEVTFGDGTTLIVPEGKTGLHAIHRDQTVVVKSGADINVSGTDAYGIYFDEMAEATLVLEENGLITATDGAYGIVIYVAQKGGRVTLNSDCHNSRHLLCAFPAALEGLKYVGFRSVCVMTRTGWKECPL